ncbi:MAG: cytochrome c [Vicinamibacterales bacterium]
MRRTVSVMVGLLFMVNVASAQAPAPQPYGTLAQLMRGIFFPNANILFDVQQHDPAKPKAEDKSGTVTATFSNIYTGWQVVENSALALAESATLLSIAGRKCENGKPAPTARADWQQFTKELVTASQAMAAAARSKNLELAQDKTNDVAGACENCHTAYRDKTPRCIP